MFADIQIAPEQHQTILFHLKASLFFNPNSTLKKYLISIYKFNVLSATVEIASFFYIFDKNNYAQFYLEIK